MATYNTITTGIQAAPTWVLNSSGQLTTSLKKDRITFEIDQECKKYDPGMYYMLIAYLYKHIENFEAVVQMDNDFRQYRIKTKVTESSGEFHFTVFYDKDVTRG